MLPMSMVPTSPGRYALANQSTTSPRSKEAVMGSTLVISSGQSLRNVVRFLLPISFYLKADIPPLANGPGP